MYTDFGQTSQTQEVQKAKYEFSWVLRHQAWLKVTIQTVENNVSNVQKAKVRKSYIEYMQITVKRLMVNACIKATYKSMGNLQENLPRVKLHVLVIFN